jgi:uncharacterized membrane protein
MAEKIDFGISSYILGIVSIVLAFFTPLAGLIFGIIGFVQSKKQKTELSKKARKFNIIGIVLSIIFLIISLVLFWIAFQQGLTNLPNFPLN